MFTKLETIHGDGGGVLLTSAFNMRYFSGFAGDSGAVWVSKNNRLVLTDSRYIEQAAGESKGFEVRETSDYLAEIEEIIANENIEKIYIEDECLSASQYLRLCKISGNAEICQGSQSINRLRMIKTNAELEIIKNAENICCMAFERILGFIKPGISEKAVAAELEYYMKQEGGEETAFETIAISGARCSLPHGVPTDKKIEKGDFVTLDFGCVIDGYSSDMTRTIVVGKASEKQRDIYNIVKMAQQKGLDAICSGICARDVDFAARKVIEEQGYGEFFRHSLGHGVGLVVHEMPNLSPKSEIILEENMVVTCEPGIYIPGFGGVRIEDMVCVKNGGYDNFTNVTKELIEL